MNKETILKKLELEIETAKSNPEGLLQYQLDDYLSALESSLHTLQKFPLEMVQTFAEGQAKPVKLTSKSRKATRLYFESKQSAWTKVVKIFTTP